MKNLIIACFAVICSIHAFAQTPTFSQGDLVFNAGVGIGSSL